MGSFSIWHWLIVLVIVLVLFGGKGKIANVMGDMAKGVKAFKQGLKDDDEPSTAAPRAIEGEGEAKAPAAGQHDATAKH